MSSVWAHFLIVWRICLLIFDYFDFFSNIKRVQGFYLILLRFFSHLQRQVSEASHIRDDLEALLSARTGGGGPSPPRPTNKAAKPIYKKTILKG